jgi:hypothetical protein
MAVRVFDFTQPVQPQHDATAEEFKGPCVVFRGETVFTRGARFVNRHIEKDGREKFYVFSRGTLSSGVTRYRSLGEFEALGAAMVATGTPLGKALGCANTGIFA